MLSCNCEKIALLLQHRFDLDASAPIRAVWWLVNLDVSWNIAFENENYIYKPTFVVISASYEHRDGLDSRSNRFSKLIWSGWYVMIHFLNFVYYLILSLFHNISHFDIMLIHLVSFCLAEAASFLYFPWYTVIRSLPWCHQRCTEGIHLIKLRAWHGKVAGNGW